MVGLCPGGDSSAKPWPCILLLYGYGGYKEQMVYYASMLHDAGFACFMFDMQGTGLLRGLPVTMGYRERWDTLSALCLHQLKGLTWTRNGSVRWGYRWGRPLR